MTDTAFECYFWDRDDMLIDAADQDWYSQDDLIADMWETATSTDEDAE